MAKKKGSRKPSPKKKSPKRSLGTKSLKVSSKSNSQKKSLKKKPRSLEKGEMLSLDIKGVGTYVETVNLSPGTWGIDEDGNLVQC